MKTQYELIANYTSAKMARSILPIRWFCRK
jgi:hypothetical protein